MNGHLVSTYMDLRGRGEGDVARTIEVVPARVLIDVDDDGMALGIETIGPKPLSLSDLFACLLVAQFPPPANPPGA